MPFEKGKSGNPAGRAKGAKTKKTLLAEAFAEHGVDVGKLIAHTWNLAVKIDPETNQPHDIKAACSMASAAMKYCYSVPDGGSDAPEISAESHTINFVTVSQSKEK